MSEETKEEGGDDSQQDLLKGDDERDKELQDLLGDEDPSDEGDDDDENDDEGDDNEGSDLEIINKTFGTNYRSVKEAKSANKKKKQMTAEKNPKAEEKEEPQPASSITSDSVVETVLVQSHPEVADHLDELKGLAKSAGQDVLTFYKSNELVREAIQSRVKASNDNLKINKPGSISREVDINNIKESDLDGLSPAKVAKIARNLAKR